MLRLCQFLLVSLAVCVASVRPSFAWSEESFVGKDKLEEFGYYESDPVVDRSMMMMAASPFSLTDSSLVASTVSFLEFLPTVRTNLLNSLIFDLRVTLPGQTIQTQGGAFLPSDAGLAPQVSVFNSGVRLFPYYNFSYPSDSDKSNLKWTPLFTGGPAGTYDGTLVLDYDVSSFESSTFEFNGLLSLFGRISPSGTSDYTYFRPYHLDILVDDRVVREFTSYNGGFDLSGFIYSGVQDVDTISLRISFDYINPIDFDTEYTVLFWISNDSTATLSSLLGEVSSPPSGMQDADNTLGDYDVAEDQYFDDAESAVGGLDTSVPDGMLGSAAMIGGMFNDLWTVLGDFSLIYFIPLLFSFFLWIIGRKRGGSG